jgi:hypothetical protein
MEIPESLEIIFYLQLVAQMSLFMAWVGRGTFRARGGEGTVITEQRLWDRWIGAIRECDRNRQRKRQSD